MSSNKSNGQKNSNQCYVEIVDDTTTEEYGKSQKQSSRAVAVLIGLFVCPLPVALVAPFLKSGVAIFVVLVLSIILYTVLCHKIIERKPEKAEVSDGECVRQPISKEKFNELKDLLDRVGPVTTSLCNGFILTPNEFKKVQYVPMYGVATNPSVSAQVFVRVSSDVKIFSERDKKLISEVFGLKEKNNVIWFSQKDIAIWTSASTVKGISFVDATGKKMYFGHTRYSYFYNHRVLLVENGECVIHIKDKQRGNHRKIDEQECGFSEHDNKEDDEYYDDDI